MCALGTLTVVVESGGGVGKIGTVRDFLPSYLSSVVTTTWLPSASVANRLLQVEDSLCS